MPRVLYCHRTLSPVQAGPSASTRVLMMPCDGYCPWNYSTSLTTLVAPSEGMEQLLTACSDYMITWRLSPYPLTNFRFRMIELPPSFHRSELLKFDNLYGADPGGGPGARYREGALHVRAAPGDRGSLPPLTPLLCWPFRESGYRLLGARWAVQCSAGSTSARARRWAAPPPPHTSAVAVSARRR